MVELSEIDFLWVEEGQVRMKIPQFEKVTARAPVFFNPVMELNRDLSVAALSFYQQQKGEDIAICDAFGGSGIRGIRYAQEIKKMFPWQ